MISRHFQVKQLLKKSYRENGSSFRLLTFDTTQIEVAENSPHGVLDHGEYLGIVTQGGILSNVEYTWVRDGKPMNLSRNARENWLRIFALSRGFSPVPIDQ